MRISIKALYAPTFLNGNPVSVEYLSGAFNRL